jgi:hypothetical protein
MDCEAREQDCREGKRWQAAQVSRRDLCSLYARGREREEARDPLAAGGPLKIGSEERLWFALTPVARRRGHDATRGDLMSKFRAILPHRAPSASRSTRGGLRSRARLSLVLLLLSTPAAAGDFNCDGYDDLVVATPYSDWSESNGGAVHILYGSSGGPSASGDEVFHDDTLGIEATAEWSMFGAGLGVGDFDGDSCDDLVVGGSEGFYAVPGASPSIDFDGAQRWDFESLDLDDWPGQTALCSGDFDGDGADDLVVTDPYMSSVADDAGAVMVVYSSGTGGLDDTTAELWHQDVSGIAGRAEEYDEFGFAATAADFNNDGYDDLAVGAPHETVGGSLFAGAVNVIFGTRYGLTTTRNRVEDQGDQGGAVYSAELFGYSLAHGDFNGDGYADLAVGARGENGGGSVTVAYGGARTWSATEWWQPGTAGLTGSAEEYAEFGHALAVGDFDDDGFDDLAVSAPRSDDDAGAVWVIYGASGGLSSSDDTRFTQDTPGIAGSAEPGDYFGDTLASGDYNGDGTDDLVIGAPSEDWYGTSDGAVHVLFGSRSGITATGDQLWSKNSTGVLGTASNYEGFGDSVL